VRVSGTVHTLELDCRDLVVAVGEGQWYSAHTRVVAI
jgi:hypothetical protein